MLAPMPVRRQLRERQIAALVALLAAASLMAGCQVDQQPTAATATSFPVATPAHAPPAASPVPATTAAPSPMVIDSIPDFRRIIREIATTELPQAQVKAEALHTTLVGDRRIPLILGDQVIFLYKGAAQSVTWNGVFNGWGERPGVNGGRVGSTDLWVGQTSLPIDARAQYKIVLNGKDWILDPANPEVHMEGQGPNNVVTMPKFKVTDETARRPDVAPGSLTRDLMFDSQSLGYTVNYWVYTPAGYGNLDDLPVLYVTDGNDFADERMGAMTIVLDNLIADGRIRPVIAVFLNAREPGNPAYNRREEEFLAHPEEFARFVAEELAPAIDATYRTDPSPDARVIQGTSYGGVSVSYIAARYPDVFHNMAAFSPAYWVLGAERVVDEQKTEGAHKMAGTILRLFDCGGDTGTECPVVPLNLFISTGIPEWDMGDLSLAAAQLHNKQYPLFYITVKEGHNWGAWKGLLDEMLIYFFGE